MIEEGSVYAPMKEKLRELEIERLVLREPNGGRIRAVLETTASPDPDKSGMAPSVRLVLLAPSGDPAVTVTVDEYGHGQIQIGHSTEGSTIYVERDSITAWAGGLCQMQICTEQGHGEIQTREPDGLWQPYHSK